MHQTTSLANKEREQENWKAIGKKRVCGRKRDTRARKCSINDTFITTTAITTITTANTTTITTTTNTITYHYYLYYYY